MDGCLQQVLIAEHNGRSPVVCNAVLLSQPGADITCLDILRWSRDVSDGLLSGEVAVNALIVIIQLVRKVVEILCYEVTCLILVEVLLVVVPIETGFPLLLHTTEECLLHLL